MIDLQKEVKKHWLYYSLLILIGSIGLIVLSLSSYNKPLQLTVVILMTVLYVLGAILHHFFTHDVHPKIVVEYILIGALGIAITFFLLRIII